jgi:hypothetical protein
MELHLDDASCASLHDGEDISKHPAYPSLQQQTNAEVVSLVLHRFPGRLLHRSHCFRLGSS